MNAITVLRGGTWTGRLRAIGPVSAILLAGAVVAWMLYDFNPGASFSSQGADGETAERESPDYFVENFVATTLDETGKPRRRVRARYMSHYPDTQTHELQEPYLEVYSDARPPWRVTSDRGWLSPEGDVMLLLGNVNIWRINEQGVRTMDVKTSDLRVLPESEYGETDKPVTITTPHSQSRAVGMKAYLGQGKMELLSQVRTTYDRDNFNQ